MIGMVPVSYTHLYLEDGSVTVNADNSGQTVTQGSGSAVPDEDPVITPVSYTHLMNNTATNSTPCPTVRKQIGKTTYIVRVHFSETAKETICLLYTSRCV